MALVNSYKKIMIQYESIDKDYFEKANDPNFLESEKESILKTRLSVKKSLIFKSVFV